ELLVAERVPVAVGGLVQSDRGGARSRGRVAFLRHTTGFPVGRKRGEAVRVLAGVAEERCERQRAVQVEADVALVGVADRVVELDGGAADVDGGARRARLGTARGGGALARGAVRIGVDADGGGERGARELALDPGVDRAVLERLEGSDRAAELAALAQV